MVDSIGWLNRWMWLALSTFPFAFSDIRPVRAAQAYLTKFPASLVRVIPELASLEDADDAGGTGMSPGSRDTGSTHDISVIPSFGKPYDLRVIGLGADRHIEVKGSSATVSDIELTVNEVAHAYNHAPTDLVVVDQIGYQKMSDTYETMGGRLRIWPIGDLSEKICRRRNIDIILPNDENLR